MSVPRPVPVAALPAWRRVLPLVVGGLLFLWVARRLDLAAFREAIARTNLPAFVGFAGLFSAALLLADVAATTRVYRRLGPVRFEELLVIRAASYLPSIVNHHVGQAWLTYFLARAYRTPLARAAGATLLVYATTLGALFVFLLSAYPLNGGRTTWLGPALAAVGAAALGYGALLLARPGVLAARPLLAPLFEAGLGGHLDALAFRLPHVGVQFLGAWVPFLLFGVDIPLGDALALMPVLMFAVTLPVSPQGLGTRDALAVALFSSYAPGETPGERAAAIAATTLSWLVVLTLAQLALSPLFYRRAAQLLGRSASP